MIADRRGPAFGAVVLRAFDAFRRIMGHRLFLAQIFEQRGQRSIVARSFILPRNLGTIKDEWFPPVTKDHPLATAPVVIHIQDAHCNYDCQMKIAEIAQYIDSTYGIGAINLEGGAAGYDLSLFRNIDDVSARSRAADEFVKAGLVNGAEYFAINSPKEPALWGVEAVSLYIENLKSYRAVNAHRGAIDGHLKSLSRVLTELKIKLYSVRALPL